MIDKYVELLLFVTLIATISLAFFTRRKKKEELYSLFRILFVLLSIHVFALMLLFYCKDIFANQEDLLYIDGISYISTCNLPVILYFIALKYENKDINLKKYCFLFIIPALTFIIIYTNPWHHLFCKNYSINVSDVDLGPYFYVHMIYTYALLVIGFIKIIKTSIKRAGFLSIGSILIIIGACAPIIPNLLASLQIISMDTYVTPIMFLITAICFYISIFKLNSFDAVPIALKSIVDIMTDSFIVVEINGNISYANKTFLGNIAPLVNLNINDNLFEKANGSKERSYGGLIKAIEYSKNTGNLTKRSWHISKSKVRRFFEIDIQPIKSAGKSDLIIGFLIVFKDVTQHVLDIETIQSNQNLLMERERLASLGQLIGGIAHNLKTPIMSISGAAEGLTDLVHEYDTSIEDPEVTFKDHHDIASDMQGWIDKIKSYTEYMSDVITTVKDQAVTLSENQKVEFSIDELVKRIDILMKHELKNALVTLNTEINVKHHKTLHGNITSLVQVINNMISNSIQAYNGEPNQTIDLIISEEANFITISVRDYGCGLPKEVQDKLFKEMITTKGKNGTGLGLFMSYSTIRAHFNGEITFESKPGEGTVFHIILPAK